MTSGPKRPLVFLVADKAMQQMLEGFFTRDGFHHTLGCAPFAIDPRPNRDIFVAAGQNDSGLFTRARELLAPHLHTHERAIVMVDNDFSASKGAEKVRERIYADITTVWAEDRVEVLVLDPEIEAWFWQPDNPHIAREMGYRGTSYRRELEAAGFWPAELPKPPRPKEAREHLNRIHRLDPSDAVFRRIAAKVSVKGCVDPAFAILRHALCEWFPKERP